MLRAKVFQVLMLIFLLAGGACSKPAETISQATPIENILPSNPLENPFETTKTLAESGDAQAQLDLARMYLYGEGVPMNEAEGVKWFQLAADQGLAEAQYTIGDWYRWAGRGFTQDDKEAARWHHLSAEQGYLPAQRLLANDYFWGIGDVTQDYNEAAKWYFKAAEQGDSNAQSWLGTLYYRGDGVIHDNIYALMWLNVARIGSQTQSFREEIESEMTAADISKAQELARECVKKEYKGC